MKFLELIIIFLFFLELFRITNESSPPFILSVQLNEGTKLAKEQRIVYAPQVSEFGFELTPSMPQGFLSFSLLKQELPKSTSFEFIKQRVSLNANYNVCIKISGSYLSPIVTSEPCNDLIP